MAQDEKKNKPKKAIAKSIYKECMLNLFISFKNNVGIHSTHWSLYEISVQNKHDQGHIYT